MIHVCFGLHDKTGHYSKFTGTAVLSIFENTNAEVTAHILHDNTLTPDNRDKFSNVAEQYNQLVKFYNVEELCPDEINFLRDKLADKINSRFSIGMFYRLLAGKILSAQGVTKVIYLDSDIVVHLDLAELWRHELGDYPLAAVPEVEATFDHMITDKFLLNTGFVAKENYLCSGVLILDLNKIDEKFFYAGVQFLAACPACESPDQDILNAFHSENYLKLAPKFNSFASMAHHLKFSVEQSIYHYAGRELLRSGMGTLFNQLWLKYFIRTPWFDAQEALVTLDATLRKLDTEHKQSLLDRVAILSNKTRVFFVLPHLVDSVKKIFSVREDEEIILAEGISSLQNLIVAMRVAAGKKVFFILVPDLPLEILTQAGFVYSIDFIDGTTFLPEAHMTKTNKSYHLVELL